MSFHHPSVPYVNTVGDCSQLLQNGSRNPFSITMVHVLLVILEANIVILSIDDDVVSVLPVYISQTPS